MRMESLNVNMESRASEFSFLLFFCSLKILPVSDFEDTLILVKMFIKLGSNLSFFFPNVNYLTLLHKCQTCNTDYRQLQLLVPL